MRIGIPNEIKEQESRVGLTPAAVAELVTLGHQVSVESNAGAGIDLFDEDYASAGARIVSSPSQLYGESDLIVKVKEPLPSEIALLEPRHTLFAYLHLAADRAQAEGLLKSGATCLAYETVTDRRGALPLLRPMSEVAGRMAIQVGAHLLEKQPGGRGILLSGVPGVEPGRVVILGGGVSGLNAAHIAVGMRADVVILDISVQRLTELDEIFLGRVRTAYASRAAIADAVKNADLVIGAVLVPGAAAPRLVTRDMLPTMKRGAVLVDIAVDQGGCFESTRPTTHENPTFVEQGVVHYCVGNMPGGVARTSTFALVHATLPYVLRLAGLGADRAMAADPGLANGLNVHAGAITHRAVAEALPGLPTHFTS
ncbi:MAG: alanine dehydrogenase [Sphingomonadaceae bacterium]